MIYTLKELKSKTFIVNDNPTHNMVNMMQGVLCTSLNAPQNFTLELIEYGSTQDNGFWLSDDTKINATIVTKETNPEMFLWAS